MNIFPFSFIRFIFPKLLFFYANVYYDTLNERSRKEQIVKKSLNIQINETKSQYQTNVQIAKSMDKKTYLNISFNFDVQLSLMTQKHTELCNCVCSPCQRRTIITHLNFSQKLRLHCRSF